jgi:tripartite-type tricarboxylate transporter receptor subunit TctC
MKRWFAAAVLGALAFVAPGGAQSPAGAQAPYPAKPVKILVPYGPGGATDIVARVMAEELRQILGASFFVENKPGAFGIIAVEEMARARPDGYTVLIGNVSTNAITPLLFAKKMSIDYVRSVTAVTRIVDLPEFMVVTAKNFPPRSVADLVAYARKNSGKVRYGTVGAGSYPHYDMAYFAKRAGDLDMIAIHNKAGGAGIINDLLSGDTQVSFMNVASGAAMARAGQIIPIALVNTARLPEYPDLPLMQEIGYAGVGTLAWQTLFAPAATPRPVLETLHKAVLQALEAPIVIETLHRQNFNIVPNPTLDDAKSWLAGEMKNWRTIIGEVPIEITE